MIKAKTASTIQISREMISMKSARTRGLITRPAISPMEWPRLRRLITRAEKSWTAPIITVPTVTHSRAGSQPQITAMAGPTMGAAPAMEVKWWPQSTSLRLGTKSTPSSNSREGTGSSSARPKTWRARKPA